MTLSACGPSSAPADPVCASHADATFQLGTGESRFLPLVQGQDLHMIRGPQGSCHLALAFLTDGFSGQRTLVRYRIQDLTTGAQVVESRQYVMLAPAGAGGDRCENVNFTAFLGDPQALEDHRLRIEVTLSEEEAGRMDSRAVEVVARWPEAVPGIERDLWCGER